MINADAKLKALFAGKNQVSMFDLAVIVNKNIIKVILLHFKGKRLPEKAASFLTPVDVRYFKGITFPSLADFLAASKISITIILFSSDDKSVGCTLISPRTTAAR